MKIKEMFCVMVLAIVLLPVQALTVPPGELEQSRQYGSQFEFIGGAYGFYNGGTRGGAGTATLLNRGNFGLDDSDDFDVVMFTKHQLDLVAWESFHINFGEYFFDLDNSYEIDDFFVVNGLDLVFATTSTRVQGVEGAWLAQHNAMVGDQVIMTGRGFSSELGGTLQWTGYTYAHDAVIDAYQYATITDNNHYIIEFDQFSARGEQFDSGSPLLDYLHPNVVVGWGESGFVSSGYGARTVYGRVDDQVRNAAYDLFGTPDPQPPVPEPATIILLGMGVVGAAVRARRY